MTEPLADVVRRRREELALGQAELAEKLGVSQQTVSRWEGGQALPRPRRVDELAEILRLDGVRLHRAAGYLPDAEPAPVPQDEVGRLMVVLSELTELQLLDVIDATWSELKARRSAAGS